MGRHTTERPVTETRWNRGERGSADRVQMRLYALAVAVRMTGVSVNGGSFVCPLTGLTVPVAAGDVDRVDPERGYRPGNVVMVARGANNERGHLQERGDDLPGVARYRADVRAASSHVNVMRKRDVATLASTVRGDQTLRPGYGALASGPYGRP